MLPIAREHPVAAQRVGEVPAEERPQPGDEAELRPVDEAPHERGDDGGHGVRQEDRQPVQRRPPQPGAVQRERGEQREHQHDRHLHGEEEQHAAHRRPELRVAQRGLVVGQPDERVAADELLAEQAQVDRVADRHDQREREDHHERPDEPPAGPPRWRAGDGGRARADLGIAALGELADIFVMSLRSLASLWCLLAGTSRASTVWFVSDVCVNIRMFT